MINAVIARLAIPARAPSVAAIVRVATLTISAVINRGPATPMSARSGITSAQEGEFARPTVAEFRQRTFGEDVPEAAYQVEVA